MACLLAFLALRGQMPADYLLQTDTTRDLVAAHECLAAGSCPLRGAPTSFPFLYQGGLWAAHVQFWMEAGLRPSDMAVLHMGINAVAIGLLGLAAFRLRGAVAAVVVVLGSIGFCRTVLFHDTLFNPTLIPFLLSVLLLAVVLAVRDRSRIAAAVSFLVMALLVQTHPLTIVLLPMTVPAWRVAANERHAWIVPVAGSGVAILSVLMLSRDALPTLVDAVGWLVRCGGGAGGHAPSRVAVLPVLAWDLAWGLAWVVLASLRVGGRRRRGEAVAVALAVLPRSLMAVVGLLAGWTPQGHYFGFLAGLMFLVPGLVAAGILETPARRLMSGCAARLPGAAIPVLRLFAWLLAWTAATVAGLVLSFREAPRAPHPSYRDVDQVIQVLDRHGVRTFRDAVRHFAGTNAPEVFPVLRVYMPEGDDRDASGLPPEFRVTMLGTPDRVVQGGRRLRWVAANGALRFDASSVSVPALQIAGRLAATGMLLPDDGSPIDRMPDAFGDHGLAFSDPTRVHLRVAVRLPDDEPRLFVVGMPDGGPYCRAVEMRVDGVEVMHRFGDWALATAPDQRGAEGVLDVTWLCGPQWLPRPLLFDLPLTGEVVSWVREVSGE